MAEFILETNYPSRRIIRQTDNPFKYKSEDEFRRIFCSRIRYALRLLNDGCFGVEPSGSSARQLYAGASMAFALDAILK